MHPQNTSIIKRFSNSIAARWNSKSHSGSIFRNMAMLASGSAAAKAIGALSVPLITRIYLPEHFGVLSVFTAITALLVPFGTLRYSMAIPLPKEDGTAANLAVLCASFLLIFSLFVTVAFWIAAPYLLDLLSMRELLPFWWLLPLAITGSGLYEILSNWAIRDKAFKPLAKTRVWQASIGAISKISLGLLGMKPLGLLIGHVFTQAGGIFSLFRSFLGKFNSTWRHVTGNRVRFLLRRYADFPKYRLPSQFLLILSTKALLLFFAWQFGAQATGQLGLALTMLALPITLFGQTTGQAYYAEIARIGRKHPEKIYKVTKSITKKLFLVSIPPFLMLFLLGPWLFEIVFGAVWRQAGLYASIIAIYLLPQFIYNPTGHGVFGVFEKQSIAFLINLIRAIMIGITLMTAVLFNMNEKATLAVCSIVMSIQYMIALHIVFAVIKVHASDHIKGFRRND